MTARYLDQIATIKVLATTPDTLPVITGTLPPPDICNHNAVKHLCAFCSKWYAASAASASSVPKTINSDKQK